MTVSLMNERRLAAPIDVEALEPSAIDGTFAADILSIEPPPDAPAWLARARRNAYSSEGSATALVRAAEAELAVGDAAAAAVAARKAISLARVAGDSSSLVGAARVLAQSGEYADAEDALAGGTHTGPMQIMRAGLAARRGSLEEARRYLARVRSSEADTLRAWIALERKDFAGAIRYLRSVMAEIGPTPTALANLGLAHAGLGNLDKAIRETRQARMLAPMSRLIRLNLIAYLMLAGDLAEARRELDGLLKIYPADLDLRIVEADFFESRRDTERAWNVLRRARTTLWGHATVPQQCVLAANLAIFEWRLGRRTRAETISAVERELERCEYRSVDIADHLAALLGRTSDAPKFGAILDAVASANPDDQLYELRIHQLVLSQEFEAATDLAVEWADADWFNASATGTAMYFLTDVRCDFETVVTIGENALRRFPASEIVRNNLAYALALSGDPERARALVDLDEARDSIFLTATLAIIDLAEARLDDAREGYRRAYELALERGDDDLALQVKVNELVAFMRLTGAGDLLSDQLTALPDGWEDDPHVALLLAFLHRYRVRESEPAG